MRATVIVVSILVVATPSYASKSCMNQAEARQHFGAVHIYWHGPDHCWDAAPGRHRVVARAQPKSEPKVVRENPDPKWREAMSEMLPDAVPIQAQAQPAPPPPSWESDGNDTDSARANWLDRWVDVVQVAPPFISRKPEPTGATPGDERKPYPIITPATVILVLSTLVLMLVIIELLLRTTVYRRRS